MAKSDQFCNRAAAAEAADDIPRSPAEGDAIGDVILRRYSRREMMRGTLGVAAATALFGTAALSAGSRLRPEHAAAAFGARHHQARRRQNRLAPSTSPTRHPGESRGPVFVGAFRLQDYGVRRNDACG
jgi:hypothetical protein